MRLDEWKIKDLLVSDITNNSIGKFGLGNASLYDVKINYPNNILLSFEVQSSSDKGATHFSNNGQELAGKSNGYEVELNFVNIANLVPSNFASLQYSQQQQILQTVFAQADIEVSCDCGAWYWQGMEQDGDKSGLSYYAFTGHPGKDIWKNKHKVAGGDSGKGICKHIHTAIEGLNSLIPNILKKIGSGTSSAQSTIQADNLQAPEQPAGVPEEKVKAEGGIKSQAAAETVQADIDEVKSTSDQLDLPTLDTTDTQTKAVKAETEAAEGPEDAEPPIEEPTKAIPGETEIVNPEENDNEDLLKQDLPKQGAGGGTLNEAFERIYEKAKDENYWLDIYNKTEPFSKENIEAINEIKRIRSLRGDVYTGRAPAKKRKKEYVGSCQELGVSDTLPWKDETECSNDLGYWTRMDSDDGNIEESNYSEIDRKEFDQACTTKGLWFMNIPGSDNIYLKRYDNNIYIVYNLNDDIHYFFW